MNASYEHNGVTIYQGNVLNILPNLPEKHFHCCVTSPPYWGLRDYGVIGQLGLESTPQEYISRMVDVFREVKRVLRDDGTLWVNMGDSYAGSGQGFGDTKTNNKSNIGSRGCKIGSKEDDSGHTSYATPPPGLKAKDLIGVPWMLALALRDDGWYLRSDIIWSKPNPMPESVTDRPTKAHEYVFLLSKSAKYYYDQDSILEPVSENTHMRLTQNLAAQIGSERAHAGGKKNGNMKAVSRRPKAWDVDMGSNRTLICGQPRKQRSRESWNGGKFDNPRDMEIRPNTGKKRSEYGKGIKYNDSFDAAVCLPVNERNKRSVWSVNVQGFSEAHFATFPEELIKPCILAGCPEGGIVLDPFFGSGTTGVVARANSCRAVGIELNPKYIEIAWRRLSQANLFVECADCIAATKHAYSEATTPGFFHAKCKKHMEATEKITAGLFAEAAKA